ncbi:heme o synthase [Thermocrinis minervae]|uniref:Protoheme IX farnesyltransferase n=1 Tax=Thermocrinis minervae TaxID=381751 RepID=A0A1M6S274_9AQUI|nr:heme o synthase [Thermocrinis minervae]SHK38952.1 protoheme IX farnesyltransferase [Thermocrinis minervae]
MVKLTKAISYTTTIRDYIALTKPGIVLLVLITTLTGMYFAKRGIPNLDLVLWTLVGTGLASGGSAVLNQVFEKDIDAIMSRTSNRPIPLGAVPPSHALVFGITLIVIALLVMFYFTNPLATFFTALAAFWYSVVYTLMLKRKTPLATEIGGVSGALPPVIGYTAVSNSLSVEPLLLFLIMFVWQPPHFWVLAIKYLEDYKKANVPALPVVAGIHQTKLKTLLYTASLLPISLLPSVYGMAGKLYFFCALILSLVYIAVTIYAFFFRKEKYMLVFFYSIIYLALLFSLMVFDMVR